MNPHEASNEREHPPSATAAETGGATPDAILEPTPDATLGPTPEPTPEATDTLTAPLPADKSATAALPTEHAVTEAHVAEPVSILPGTAWDEVRYEPEQVPGGPPTSPSPPATSPTDADIAPWRGPRMRTVVLGLVLLAISGTGLVRMLTDVRIDDTVVLLTLLIVAGALLLGGGVASAVREARIGRRD